MKTLKALAATAVCVVAGVNPLAAHADVTVGVPLTGNCYPVSCFASDNGGTYQQVYAAAAFSGLTHFDTLTFFRGDQWGNGSMDTATYALSFYLTPFGPGALTSTAADNRGALLSSFGNFSFSGPLPEALELTGSSINYDPQAGNLLLDLRVTGLSAGGGYQSSFQADYSGVLGSRYFAYGNSGTGSTDNILVVTRFSLSNAASQIPEPATWSIVIAALAGMGVAMARRRNRVAPRLG